MAGSNRDGFASSQQVITCSEMPRALERDCCQHWYAIVFSTSRKTLPNDTGKSAAARELQGIVLPGLTILQARCLACDLVGGFKGEGCPLHVCIFSYAAIRLARESQRLGVRRDVGQAIVRHARLKSERSIIASWSCHIYFGVFGICGAAVGRSPR